MTFKLKYYSDIEEIIKLISEDKIEGENNALFKFDLYVKEIVNIGKYDSINWPQNWRVMVWKLGEQFKSLNPEKFLKVLNENLQNHNNKEVLEFLKLEIIFNYFPSSEIEKNIISLVKLYPLNPEFRHNLGHVFKNEGKLLEAIAEYKFALKIEFNNKYLRSRFVTENEYLNILISESDYKKGQDYVNLIFQEDIYSKDVIYYNAFVGFNCRFQDHILLDEKIRKLEDEFKKKMNEELDAERKRIIEVVGFFSGIVAFILSTVSIGENFSFIEAICFIIGLGLVLILFAISMSILFNTSRKKYYQDKKFWILIIGIIALFMYLLWVNAFA